MLRFKEKGLFTSEASFEREFHNVFRPVVVLANEKSALNDRYASADIKALVTRSDRLVAYIKHMNEHAGIPEMSDKQMQTLAKFFDYAHTTKDVDYTEKYRLQMIEEDKKACPKCGKEMVLRESKRGATAGNKFWGCTGYPKCGFTAKLNE